MKFVINKSDFFQGLQKVIGVLPTKTTIPILSNILLSLEDETLTLSGTDLEISISTMCQVSEAEAGGISIPGRRFFEIVRELPDLPLSISTDENHQLTLSNEKGIYKFVGEEDESFPRIAVEEAENEFTISGNKFVRMIDKSIYAVSMDELRSTLMGVSMEVMANELRMIATDGHRLAKIVDRSFEGDDLNGSVILPTKALQLLSRTLQAEETLKVSIGENHVVFSFADTRIFTKLIEGQFPNYDRVIPKDNTLEMTVDKESLIAAMRRVSIFSNAYTHQIIFSIRPSSLIIQAEDIELGGEAQESIQSNYSGDAMEVGYNAAYLLDIIRHVDTDRVLFQLKDPTSAAMIKPTEQEPNEDLIMVLMPIRLNDSI